MKLIDFQFSCPIFRNVRIAPEQNPLPGAKRNIKPDKGSTEGVLARDYDDAT